MPQTSSRVKPLSNGAQLLRALMRFMGTSSTAELEAATGCHRRMIQRWKAEIFSTEIESDNRDICDKRDTSVACQSTEHDTSVASVATNATPVSHPSRMYARARFESPSEIVLEEVVKIPPNPQGGIGTSEEEVSFFDEVRETTDGRLKLGHRLAAFWLERFGGDEGRLELALVEAAAIRQPNSRQPLRLQVERTLARIAGQRRDSDSRYAAAVRSRPQLVSSAGASPRSWQEAEIERSREFWKTALGGAA
jgi:hypothetical protein